MAKKWRILLSVVILMFGITAIGLAADAGKAATADTVWPAAAIKWEPGPLPGVKVAKLWGDWTKGGPYGVLVKFDAGVMNPLHKHTQTLKIVVLSGTFVHQPAGGAETKLGPGSYLVQVGGKNHVSGCAAGAECEFFMTSADKFDLIPAKAPAPKKK